jgi:methionine-gamma-lyase
MKNAKHPESLMMSHGYEPTWSEGSVKPPLFLTSTFVFNTAEEGKAHFELAYGLREPDTYEECGLIYSRLNNPNLEILENRLSIWDDAEACAVMQSGMAAVSTSLLTFVKPGDVLVYSRPTYGGTEHFISHVLQDIGVHVIGFDASHSEAQIAQMIDDSGLAHKVAMIYVETPANPTNSLIDIGMCKSLAQRYSNDERQVLLAVDNTYMGPLWCKPMEHGADLVLYSATKYLGGHSDLIAGAIVGSTELITQIKGMRTFLGNMPSPHTCWLLMRSLETLKIRMTQQAINAATIAESLVKHPMVVSVNYLGLMTPTDRDYDLYKRQYSSGGAMIAFTVQGGEKEAFTVLNHLNLIKLAVSLGGTESLAQHPASMTHAGLDPDLKADMGIGDNLIRLSIGIENQEDLMADIHQALSAINDAVLN